MSRRSRAVLIRVRQELQKRLERLAPVPGAPTPADAVARLAPDAARRVAAGDSLHAVLAAGADERLPLAALRARRDAPSDAAALLAEARAILGGEWRVFGQRADAFARGGDWRADPVDGRASPLAHWTRVPYLGAGGDVKRVWEHNRHHALVRLAQAYHLTGDEAFAEAAVRQLERWAAQNPPRHGVNWTSSLEVAFRAIAWCWIWQLTHRAPAWTAARTATFVWQLWHHARYVEHYDSVHHSPNTHLTGEALGLLYVGTLFPALRRAARWRAFGAAILLEEVEHQFLADGFHYERAVGYHRYHVEFYLHALLLLRQRPEVPAATLAALADRLRDGFGAMAALVRPDGSWPVLGDEDGGSTLRLAAAPAGDLRPLLAVGAAIFREPTWRHDAAPGADALAWWLCDEAALSALRELPPAVAAGTAALLPAAGYAVARDAWSPDAWYCLVDVGPHGGEATGHAHTDLAHVEVSRGGTRLLVDPGSLTYTGDPAHRAWHRAETAHARPTVDGVPLAEAAGPFAWRRVAPTPAFAVDDDGRLWQCRLHYTYGEPGPTSRRVTHERHVVLLRGVGVIVCDWVDGAHAPVRWHWPVGSARDALQVEPGRLVAGDLAWHWQVAPGGPGAMALEEHRFAPSYAVAEPGTVLTVATPPTERARGVACALDAAAPTPHLEVVGDDVRCGVAAGDEWMVVEFARGRPAVARPAGAVAGAGAGEGDPRPTRGSPVVREVGA